MVLYGLDSCSSARIVDVDQWGVTCGHSDKADHARGKLYTPELPEVRPVSPARSGAEITALHERLCTHQCTVNRHGNTASSPRVRSTYLAREGPASRGKGVPVRVQKRVAACMSKSTGGESHVVPCC